MPASSTMRPVRAGKVGAARATIDVSVSARSVTKENETQRCHALIVTLVGVTAVTSVELHLGGLRLLLLDGEGRHRLVARIDHPGPEAAGEGGELGIVLTDGLDVVAPCHCDPIFS